MKQQPTYKQAVQWIAGNDEPRCLDHHEMKDLISVCLVADLFGYRPDKVARDVVKFRVKSNDNFYGKGKWKIPESLLE